MTEVIIENPEKLLPSPEEIEYTIMLPASVYYQEIISNTVVRYRNVSGDTVNLPLVREEVIIGPVSPEWAEQDATYIAVGISGRSEEKKGTRELLSDGTYFYRDENGTEIHEANISSVVAVKDLVIEPEWKKALRAQLEASK